MTRISASEYVNAAGGAKPNKYGAKRTVVDGQTFDSRAEARRWQELVVLQRAGKITGLERQVRIPLMAHNGEVIGHYVADAVYFNLDEHGRTTNKVVEDVKGGKATQTPLFTWKARHFRAQFGFAISIVGGRK